MWAQFTWDMILLALLTSFASTLLFSLMMSRITQRIEISKLISNEIDEDGNNFQAIKLINRGPRDAVDVKFELQIVKDVIVPDGVLSTSREVSLKYKGLFVLDNFKKDTKNATFAFRMRIVEDLKKNWHDEENEYLRFRVYAKDEMSGFGKLFEEYYRVKRVSIKDGTFHFGNSFEIS